MLTRKTKFYLVIAAIFSLAILYLFRNVFVSQIEYCPLSINTKDQIENQPKGWEVLHMDQPSELRNVHFFDGPAHEWVYLKPEEDQEETQMWKLPSNARGYSLVCHYTGTKIVLAKKLEPQLTSCRVNYDEGRKVEGFNGIKNIECH